MPVTEGSRADDAAIERPRTWRRVVSGPISVYGPVTLLAVAALAVRWPDPHWGWQLGWTVVAAYALFCWTSCFHEAAHLTLWPWRALNVWLGRLLGTVMVTPYTVYREAHIRHHAYLNKPADWELWPYADPGRSLTFRRVFVWLDLAGGLVTAPWVYGRIFFHRDSPLTSPATRRTIRLEYLGCVAFWGAVAAALTIAGAWPTFVRAWLVPAALAGAIQTGRKLTDHLGLASYDPMLGARSVVGRGLLTRLTAFVNFNIFVQGLHHRHPRLAHDRLAPRLLAYRAAHPDRSLPVFSSYGRAVLAMLPWLIRNPGVGVNVGAPRPAPDSRRGVEDFVGDVNREILSPSEAVW